MLNKITVRKCWIYIALCAFVWFGLHVPSLEYGARDVPLYITYIGDEQVPVNGALHVLKEQNLLALRDANKAYYGPLMVMLAVPGAVFDFARAALFEGVSSALAYRNHVVWDWGGMLMFGRTLAIVVGFIGLYLMGRILLLSEINPRRHVVPVLLAVTLLATEYFYFHYTAQFRHWVFLTTILLAQLYVFFLMRRDGFASLRYWIIQAALTITTFGISYLGVFFQAVWALPVFGWLRQPHVHKTLLKRLVAYAVSLAVGAALIIWWHPNAFFRIIGIVGADIQNDQAALVLEEDYGNSLSFGYYADLFFNNHASFTLGVLVLAAAAWRFRAYSNLYAPVGVLLLAYGVLFGVQSHHSTHYFLPAIVLVHLLAGLLLVRLWTDTTVPLQRYVLPVAIFFFGAQLAFNAAVLTKLLEVLTTPPADRVLAYELLALQERDGGATLLSGCGPVGVPHTREAYADFASRAERDKTNLYGAMLESTFPFPEGVTLLDAYYDDNLPPGERRTSGAYARIVLCKPFNPEGEPNLRLLHETRLLNYWQLEPYMDRYEFIYPEALRDVMIQGIRLN
jgi:hypothetical protein